MARAAKTAEQISANWQAGMAGARNKYVQGIQALTSSPTAAAATDDAQQRYLANIQESVSSGRRAAALNAVSLQAFQAACIGKGADRLSSGATQGKQAHLSAMQKWAPIYAQASQAAAGVPKSDTLGRVRAAINAMKAAAGKPTI